MLKIILFYFFLSASGCTTIKVTSSDGKVNIKRGFGLVKISPGPNSSTFAAKMSGFGFFSNPFGISVGYSDQTIVKTNKDCKIILLVDSSSIKENIVDEIRNLKNTCIYK